MFLESAISRSVLPNKKFTGLPGEKKKNVFAEADIVIWAVFIIANEGS